MGRYQTAMAGLAAVLFLLSACGTHGTTAPAGAPRVHRTGSGWSITGLHPADTGSPWYAFGPRGGNLFFLSGHGLWRLNVATGHLQLLLRLDRPVGVRLLFAAPQGIYFSDETNRQGHPFTRIWLLPSGTTRPTLLATSQNGIPAGGTHITLACGTLDLPTQTWHSLALGLGPDCRPLSGGRDVAILAGLPARAALILPDGRVRPLAVGPRTRAINPFIPPGPDVVLGIMGPGGLSPDMGGMAFGSMPEANNLLLFSGSGQLLARTRFRSRFLSSWWMDPQTGAVLFDMSRTGFDPKTGLVQAGPVQVGMLTPDGTVRVLGSPASLAADKVPPTDRQAFLRWVFANGWSGVALPGRMLQSPLAHYGPFPWQQGYLYFSWHEGTKTHSFTLNGWNGRRHRQIARLPGSLLGTPVLAASRLAVSTAVPGGWMLQVVAIPARLP